MGKLPRGLPYAFIGTSLANMSDPLIFLSTGWNTTGNVQASNKPLDSIKLCSLFNPHRVKLRNVL